jgi:nitrogen regulatory protein PII
MEQSTKFELVVCIVNAGFSQNVVDASRKVGARGGTILRGRGSANPESEEFFNIVVQPDKELVLMLVPSKIKDTVLQEIYKETGLSKDGQGIAFTLPVTRTTTVKVSDDLKKEEKKD